MAPPCRTGRARVRDPRMAADLVASLREARPTAARGRPGGWRAGGDRGARGMAAARPADTALRRARSQRPARPDLRAASRPGGGRCARPPSMAGGSAAALRPDRGARRRRPWLRRAHRRAAAVPRVEPGCAPRARRLGGVPGGARTQLPPAGPPVSPQAGRARPGVLPARRRSRAPRPRPRPPVRASPQALGRRRRPRSSRRARSTASSPRRHSRRDGCGCGSSRSPAPRSPPSTASGSPAPSRRTRPAGTPPSRARPVGFVLLAPRGARRSR